MSRRVLIRLKGGRRVLVAVEGGKAILAEVTELTKGHNTIWNISADGVITNVHGNRLLTVSRDSNAVVVGSNPYDGKRSTKWEITDEGMIQHSGFGMCLCVPSGQLNPEVRLPDQDTTADDCQFYWELLSEGGELLSAAHARAMPRPANPGRDDAVSNFGYPGPGPQTPTVQDVMVNAFFVQDAEWNAVQESGEFDFVVIGSGFCSLAFVTRALKNNPFARILILERGSFLLPDHFQNLPMPFMKALKGTSETHPWSVTEKTHRGKHVQFQHGVVPFVGGRSTTWSGWCPKPSDQEMEDWPKKAVDVVHEYFSEAEKLMNVVPVSEIYERGASKPMYGGLQRELDRKLQSVRQQVTNVTRIEPARLATKAPSERHVPFHKFAVPGPLFQLLNDQREKATHGTGWVVKMAVNCTVSKILHTADKATDLETSRGKVVLGDAKVVLAMGSLPPTTLIHNSFPKESFPSLINIGERFTGHTVSVVTARIPRSSLTYGSKLAEIELAAMYIAGLEPNSGAQYHIQLSAVTSNDCLKAWDDAFHYLPDVRAAPSKQQFATSKDHVFIVCAVLGELDHTNKDNWFRQNGSSNPCVNTDLQIVLNEQDNKLWNTMEAATFQVIEDTFGKSNVEYWHETSIWSSKRPPTTQIRGPGIVHEASTMWMGDEGDKDAPVGIDYRPRGVENVYITGAALYPRCGSWNPTGPMVALAIHLADTISPPNSTL